MSESQLDPHVILLRVTLITFLTKSIPNLKNKDPWTRQDFEQIAIFLETVLREKIKDDVEFAKVRELSVQTLERFFLKYRHQYDVSRSTLDKLSMCVGFTGFQHFKNEKDFDKLKEKDFNHNKVTGVCYELFFAYKLLPYTYGFSSYFEHQLGFELGARMLEIRNEGKYLVDGVFSGHHQKGHHESFFEVTEMKTALLKPNEIWIETNETWRFHWTTDFKNPKSTIITQEGTDTMKYQLRHDGELWRVWGIQGSRKLHPFIFK